MPKEQVPKGYNIAPRVKRPEYAVLTIDHGVLHHPDRFYREYERGRNIFDQSLLETALVTSNNGASPGLRRSCMRSAPACSCTIQSCLPERRSMMHVMQGLPYPQRTDGQHRNLRSASSKLAHVTRVLTPSHGPLPLCREEPHPFHWRHGVRGRTHVAGGSFRAVPKRQTLGRRQQALRLLQCGTRPYVQRKKSPPQGSPGFRVRGRVRCTK